MASLMSLRSGSRPASTRLPCAFTASSNPGITFLVPVAVADSVSLVRLPSASRVSARSNTLRCAPVKSASSTLSSKRAVCSMSVAVPSVLRALPVSCRRPSVNKSPVVSRVSLPNVRSLFVYWSLMSCVKSCTSANSARLKPVLISPSPLGSSLNLNPAASNARRSAVSSGALSPAAFNSLAFLPVARAILPPNNSKNLS